MSPPLLGIGEEESQSSVTLLASSSSIGGLGHKSLGVKQRNYMGYSDCSSVDSSKVATTSDKSKAAPNLKATELRLGLPGSQSPERDQLDEKPFFPLHPSSVGHYSISHKTVVAGNQRGFSDVMDGFSEGKYLSQTEVNVILSPSPNSKTCCQPGKAKEVALQKIIQEKPYAAIETGKSHNGSANNNCDAPATKAQIVGWPPIRSFRKNSLVTNSKNSEETDVKAVPGALFVKVSMDGAPYLRKVDLRNYAAYQELSSALEKMFSCFTIGQYGSHGSMGREMLSESKLMDLLHGSEYVLTYEDKDGDWMLVGDVPWEMFIDSCKRMRIMKSSDAIGLAPRAVAKCKDRN